MLLAFDERVSANKIVDAPTFTTLARAVNFLIFIDFKFYLDSRIL